MNLPLLVILKKTYFFIFNEYLEQLQEYVLVQNEIQAKLILNYMYSRQKLVCIFLCCRHDTTIFKQRKYKSNYSPDQMIMGHQGFALREIIRSPKFPNYEIQGAQHKAYMKEIRLSGRPKAKVSRLRHPGILRAQPWTL